MATKKKSKKELSASTKVGIGVGLTATAVAAAGAYFLYGTKEAKSNRKKVKSWMLKAKAEVLETLEKAEEITEDEYKDLIASVSKGYSKLKDASKVDVRDFQKEMVDHWKEISKAAKPVKKKVAKQTVKKPVKKATSKKKPARKTTKKK
ncbi:hypothetical protein CL653_00020 [bacterium]|nr:hypothetical protein [bacterium]|tara:strand:- start:158 stop:604 length:447 start_codon:yes stop_codon:yes gene_type:complete